MDCCQFSARPLPDPMWCIISWTIEWNDLSGLWIQILQFHYNGVTMSSMASQITSLTIVYSTVYSDADQRNIKASRHWPLWGEFTGDRWIPRTNGQLRGKCSHLMTSSCLEENRWAFNHQWRICSRPYNFPVSVTTFLDSRSVVDVLYARTLVCILLNVRLNILRPRQNGRNLADDIIKRIFMNKKVWISIKISLKFVPSDPINNIPALVQIMAWRRPGDKP